MTMPDETIILFSQPGCPPCDWLKAYLTAKGIVFEVKDVSSDADAARQLIEKYHSRSTPTLVVGGEVIVGFDPERLEQLFSKKDA